MLHVILHDKWITFGSVYVEGFYFRYIWTVRRARDTLPSTVYQIGHM